MHGVGRRWTGDWQACLSQRLALACVGCLTCASADHGGQTQQEQTRHRKDAGDPPVGHDDRADDGTDGAAHSIEAGADAVDAALGRLRGRISAMTALVVGEMPPMEKPVKTRRTRSCQTVAGKPWGR